MIDWSLYLVTDPYLGGGRDRVADVVRRAIAGGVTVVQLRDKHASDEEFRATATELIDVVGDVPLFLNDRVHIAAELGTHLHIGQGDLAYTEARQLLRPEQIIGLSVGTDTELDATLNLPGRGPDVLGIGPVRSTATKVDAPAGIGVAATDRLAARAREAGVASVAIGGIDAAVAADLADTSVAGVCVVSTIMASADPAATAAQLREAFAR